MLALRERVSADDSESDAEKVSEKAEVKLILTDRDSDAADDGLNVLDRLWPVTERCCVTLGDFV